MDILLRLMGPGFLGGDVGDGSSMCNGGEGRPGWGGGKGRSCREMVVGEMDDGEGRLTTTGEDRKAGPVGKGARGDDQVGRKGLVRQMRR